MLKQAGQLEILSCYLICGHIRIVWRRRYARKKSQGSLNRFDNTTRQFVPFPPLGGHAGLHSEATGRLASSSLAFPRQVPAALENALNKAMQVTLDARGQNALERCEKFCLANVRAAGVGLCWHSWKLRSWRSQYTSKGTGETILIKLTQAEMPSPITRWDGRRTIRASKQS